MLHLPADRLAALADEYPTAAEAAHLAECAACSGEREAHKQLRALAASEWARLAPPVTSWDGIAGRLRSEGLLPPASQGASSAAWRGVARLGLRAAAALLLVGGGVATGRYSAGASPLPLPGEAAVTVVRSPSSPVESVGDDAPTFASRAAALEALARAERQYQYAATYLVEQDPSAQPLADSSEVYRNRLAAFDDVLAATRMALYEAPHDPVINRYYLATMGAREATIRQLSTALPVGMQINRY
jgi:hypothetical protein